MTKTGKNPKTKPPREHKTIYIPFESEEHYERCLKDNSEFRKHVEQWVQAHPELFPDEFSEGFNFYGSYRSKKQKTAIRRIVLKKSKKEVYQIHPSSMMPYMTAKTDDVEKALYLRLWNVPFDALAYVFGKNATFWYRLFRTLGIPSIVGTTVKDAANLPQHLVADEKHTWLKGEKIYAATTVGNGCILGVAAATGAGNVDYANAYGKFADEAREVNPDYCPETVGTDGWSATDNAWRKHFPKITVIICFLHSVLKLRDRCRAYKEWVNIVQDKAWKVYSATTRAEFLKRFRRLRAWAKKQAPKEIREALLAMGRKAKRFAKAYDFAGAHRTSNAVDRLMDYQDRVLYAMRYFHGTVESATAMLRAQAMLWNFHPYGARLRQQDPNRISPFADLNGYTYHENWLHNFLIAASLGGRKNQVVKRQ